MTTEYLTLKRVIDIVKYSESYILKLEKAGRFPAKKHFSSGLIYWEKKEIDEFLKDPDNYRSNKKFIYQY